MYSKIPWKSWPRSLSLLVPPILGSLPTPSSTRVKGTGDPALVHRWPTQSASDLSSVFDKLVSLLPETFLPVHLASRTQQFCFLLMDPTFDPFAGVRSPVSYQRMTPPLFVYTHAVSIKPIHLPTPAQFILHTQTSLLTSMVDYSTAYLVSDGHLNLNGPHTELPTFPTCNTSARP